LLCARDAGVDESNRTATSKTIDKAIFFIFNPHTIQYREYFTTLFKVYVRTPPNLLTALTTVAVIFQM
ncbi:MAG: hypothetical protein QXH85_05975, partial [Candidatus Bathyarchaeia archaeon]